MTLAAQFTNWAPKGISSGNTLACGLFFSPIWGVNNPDHCSTAISEKSSERHLPGKRKHWAFAEGLPLTGC
jgi:hypothetical protein